MPGPHDPLAVGLGREPRQSLQRRPPHLEIGRIQPDVEPLHQRGTLLLAGQHQVRTHHQQQGLLFGAPLGLRLVQAIVQRSEQRQTLTGVAGQGLDLRQQLLEQAQAGQRRARRVVGQDAGRQAAPADLRLVEVGPHQLEHQLAHVRFVLALLHAELLTDLARRPLGQLGKALVLDLLVPRQELLAVAERLVAEGQVGQRTRQRLLELLVAGPEVLAENARQAQVAALPQRRAPPPTAVRPAGWRAGRETHRRAPRTGRPPSRPRRVRPLSPGAACRHRPAR